MEQELKCNNQYTKQISVEPKRRNTLYFKFKSFCSALYRILVAMKGSTSLKFPISVIIALVTSSLFLAGCDFGGNQSDSTLENPYSYVGDQHSAGLDYALDQLKDSPESISRKALRQLAERSSREYAERQGLNLKRFDVVEVGVDAASSITSVSEVDLSSGLVTSSSSSETKILPDSLKSRLSDAQLHFINRIMELVEGEPSVEDLKSDLSSLNGEVRKELREDQARVVLIASAVALDSWTYWTQNGDEWVEAIREKQNSSASAQNLGAASVNSGDDGSDGGDDSSSEEGDFSWSDVGKADIAGGVGGAAGGAVAGAMAGGVGAGPGAAAGGAGGAVGGSVTSATSQLLDEVW